MAFLLSAIVFIQLYILVITKIFPAGSKVKT